jgi:amino-acid N-acetyltransferase
MLQTDPRACSTAKVVTLECANPWNASMKQLAFGPDVATLLAAAALPSEDLHGGDNVLLFGEQSSGRLTAVVGLECYGHAALIRSLAVDSTERGKGMGNKLVEYAEAKARSMGATHLYLLTTTAQKFFERQGYQSIERAAAPEAIARTAQFSGLCPASSAFMVKQLR